jgi:hypothetical protein
VSCRLFCPFFFFIYVFPLIIIVFFVSTCLHLVLPSFLPYFFLS